MGGPTRLKLVSLGAGAQADTIPNRRQGQRSKVPELSVLSTCAIGFPLPPITPKFFWGCLRQECSFLIAPKILPRTIVADRSTSFDLFFAPFQEFLILCFVFFNLFLLELLTPEKTIIGEVIPIIIFDRLFQILD